MENEKKEEVVVTETVEKTELQLAIERAEKAEQERDNYKAVALKRKGKLKGDAEFFNEEDGEGELSVADQVKIELLNKEAEDAKKAEKLAQAKLEKENAELRLALKNRPNGSVGTGGSGEELTVKDNILSEQQILNIKARAERLGVKDVDAFVEKAKQNLLKNR